MISSGTTSCRPVSEDTCTPNVFARFGRNNDSSLCNTPMAIAASAVTANEENRPTSAAANAGSTVSVSTAPLKVTVGASRMAASVESRPASAKFATSITDGDQPDVAATCRSSATAEVARPNTVLE